MLKRAFVSLLLLILFSGCAAVPVQPQAVHGVTIETLQGSVNISLSSPGGSLSGNGVLFYRSPDSFRLSILAPFGQVMLDIIVAGERVLCLKESSKKGWQGVMADLPDALGVQVWPLMKWVVEPPHPPGPARERVFTRPDGTVEKVYYDPAGFVQRKLNASGDEVLYSDYRVTENIAIPNRIEINTAEGSRMVLAFDEPELNLPIESGIFSPQLEGYEILPLAGFRGF